MRKLFTYLLILTSFFFSILPKAYALTNSDFDLTALGYGTVTTSTYSLNYSESPYASFIYGESFTAPSDITGLDFIVNSPVTLNSANKYEFYTSSVNIFSVTAIDIIGYVYGSQYTCTTLYAYVEEGNRHYIHIGFQCPVTVDQVQVSFRANSGYLLAGGTHLLYQPYFLLLSDKTYTQVLNNIQQGIYETNQNIQNIQNSIVDETPPTLSGLSSSAGWLPAGPVDSILNLPLTMLNSLLNNLGNSCTPLDLPLPYVNRTLTLPCLNSIYSQIDGLSVWINGIATIASAFILYSYLLKLYKWVDDTLTFRENNHCDWGGV